jgi:hypothetical protein
MVIICVRHFIPSSLKKTCAHPFNFRTSKNPELIFRRLIEKAVGPDRTGPFQIDRNLTMAVYFEQG